MQSKDCNVNSIKDRVIEEMMQEYANKDNERVEKDLKADCAKTAEDFCAKTVHMQCKNTMPAK